METPPGMTKIRPTRRECLAALAASTFMLLPFDFRADAAPTQAPVRSAPPMTQSGKPMRGAFMILNTPFTESGEVDWGDLAREVDFVDRCGCQGMVWPQGSSGLATLTKEERLHGMEVLANAIHGKKAILGLGVQGRNTPEMLEYAQRAEQLKPDAMIAMPPSDGKTVDDYRVYYRALAAVTKRPVIVQSSGGAPDLAPPVDLLVELASQFPNFGYVKEESAPIVERMEMEVQHRPPLRGIFGAVNAQGWLYEMRLGLDGVITGEAMYADVMAKLWELHETGKSEELREAYSKFLLMRNLITQIPSTDLYILKKRGIFKTMAERTAPPSGGTASATKITVKQNADLTPSAVEEIEYRFAALKPYLTT